MKGMEVEFGLHVYKSKQNPDKSYVRAKTVTLPGAVQIAVQDDLDAEKKTFVGGQHLRYTGKLKFYRKNDGFGYVQIDDGFSYPAGEDVPKEIRVEEAEVNCGGSKPMSMK